jgi:hypothetical protein
VLEASVSAGGRTTGEAEVLIDSGAVKSVGVRKLVDRLGLKIMPTDVRLHTANMQELPVLGKVEVTIAFADHAVSSNTMRFELVKGIKL